MSMLIEEPYNSDVVLQILLDAGRSRVLILGPEVGYVYSFFHLILAFAWLSHAKGQASRLDQEKNRLSNVKKSTELGKSAGVTRDKPTLEASQRLNAGDPIYAYLVGLIEGDG